MSEQQSPENDAPHIAGCLAGYPLGCLGIECACACHIPPAQGSGYCPDACTWAHDHHFERDGIPWPARTTVLPPACGCPPGECHEAGASGCYFGTTTVIPPGVPTSPTVATEGDGGEGRG